MAYRVLIAQFMHETNTFSKLKTTLEDYRKRWLIEGADMVPHFTGTRNEVGGYIDSAKKYAWEPVWALAANATPSGKLTRECWETIRDRILAATRAAGKLDGICLSLHGAMVTETEDDAEGALLEALRGIVGPDVPIGVELDPHCHMTVKRVRNATLIICFKEFPHTDFVDRGEEVVELTLRAIRGEIRPVMSLADCRMIGSFPTTLQPMRGFVDKISALEGHDGVLSVSIAHCFPYADVPELGSRILVVTDGRREQGDRLAMQLAEEFHGMRGRTQPPYLDPDGIIDAVAQLPGPVVVADPSDNPGGGAPGDSTQLLRRLIERGVQDVALGPVWDPIAVRLCFMAGEGGQLQLRFGGKTAPASGLPIDAKVTVKALRRDAYQTFVDAKVPLGDCATIAIDGIEVVLISNRTQALGRDLFTAQGVTLEDKRIVAVKSTNHFHAAFAPIASKVLYCDSGGPIPRDHRQVPYTRIQRPIWPLDEGVAPRLIAL